MATQRFTRRRIGSWALLAGSAAVVAACGQGAAGGSGLHGSTSSGQTQAGSTPIPGTPQQPVPRAPECKAASLALHLGRGAGSGAGSSFPALQFTNTGGVACQMVGFPGVSYVDKAGGQVGLPAVRSGDLGAPVLLRPGDTGSAQVKVPTTDNFPANDCRPVPVMGFGVYPPDDDTRMFVRFDSPEATACSNTAMASPQQLFVQSVKEGSGDQ